MLQVSQNAEDLVIAEEVGSRQQFEKKYRHPEWPGGASGVTVAIGYDLGYATKERVASDWANVPQQITALQSVTGLKGGSAQAALPSVRSQIDISYEQAIHVFDNLDKPRWIATVDHAVPNCSKLDPNCLGALWSLAYNRGASFNLAGDRYAEMRAIKAHMIAEDFDKIPGEFRSMKRLWNNGLVGRREREAKLFERGLSIMRGGHIEETAPKVATRTEQVKRNAVNASAATGAATGTATGVAPTPVKTSDHHGYFVGAAVVIGLVLGFAVVMYVGRHRILPKADPV